MHSKDQSSQNEDSIMSGWTYDPMIELVANDDNIEDEFIEFSNYDDIIICDNDMETAPGFSIKKTFDYDLELFYTEDSSSTNDIPKKKWTSDDIMK